MHKVKTNSLFALMALLVSVVGLNASYMTGGYLVIKNKSTVPVTLEWKTRINVHTYSSEESPFADIDQKNVINPNEEIQTEIPVPNPYPIQLSLTVDNVNVINSYVIPKNGFTNRGSESKTVNSINATISWPAFSKTFGPFDPPYPVYLEITASHPSK